jgi:hypothetical protein
MNRWYPVRCCCTPKKIFGFIRLPDLPMGESVNISSGDDILTFKLQKFGGYEYGVQSNEYAVPSEDRPIEFWRSLPNFLELAPDACQNAERIVYKQFASRLNDYNFPGIKGK